jgi:acyl-CoA thioester hydrolase
MAEASYRGTVYPWQWDHVGHMNIMWCVGKFDEANWNVFASSG